MGATVNADYLRKRLTGVNSLHLVVDGAMFVDNPEQTRQQVMRNIFKNTFYLHNIQGERSSFNKVFNPRVYIIKPERGKII